MCLPCTVRLEDLGHMLLGAVSLAPSGPITLQKVSEKYFIGQCEEKLNRCGIAGSFQCVHIGGRVG